MKPNFKYIYILPLALLLSCEEEVETFMDDANRINFSTASTITPYSFAYGPKDKMEDTVFIEISTVGFITGTPRKVLLTQVPFNDGRPEAVAGQHYLDFKDPAIAGRYVIPAGRNNALFPVLIKRDASLQTKEVSLRIGIVPNEYFKLGFTANQSKTITISDFLTMPSSWTSGVVTFYGAYGKVKHQFMMDAVAPLGYIVNNDFLKDLMGGPTSDAGLRGYWVGFMKAKLIEVNAKRASQGLGPLREAPLAGQTEGTPVVFP